MGSFTACTPPVPLRARCELSGACEEAQRGGTVFYHENDHPVHRRDAWGAPACRVRDRQPVGEDP